MKHGTCKNCGGRIYRMERPTYMDWKHYSNFNVRCPGSPVAEPKTDLDEWAEGDAERQEIARLNRAAEEAQDA